MAGSVNKVILVGNLGADPEVRRFAKRRPGRQFAHRHLRDLARQEQRRAQGKDRVASGRHLQRPARQGGRAISEEGRQGLSRGPASRPANGRRTASSATRPKLCFRNSAAKLPDARFAAARAAAVTTPPIAAAATAAAPISASPARATTVAAWAAAVAAATWTTRSRSEQVVNPECQHETGFPVSESMT